MKALMLFHLRVGARVAALSFAPLFCSIVALIMLNVNPAATIVGIALGVFGTPASSFALAGIVVLSLVMAARAAPRITHGLNGWMRQLAVSGACTRRMCAMAMVVAQSPLMVSLLILGFVASSQGANGLWQRSLRLSMLPVAAGYAALPVRRRWIAGPLSLSAAILVLFGSGWLAAASVGILILVELTAGPIRESSRSRRPWSSAGSSLSSRIAWRALGWRIFGAYVAPLAALAATALFIGNNAPPAALAEGALRLGGSLSLALFLSRLAHKLATRRPAWHFARSLPWSSASRILADCVFMGLHTVPLLILLAALDWHAIPMTLSVLPFLSLRAAGYIRTIPEHRVHAGLFLLEGFVVSASLALLPWASLIWLLAAGPAYLSARQQERHQKVSRWQELHFAAEGDTLTWSK